MAQSRPARLQPMEQHFPATGSLGNKYTNSEWISFFAKPDMMQQVKHEGGRQTGSIPNQAM